MDPLTIDDLLLLLGRKEAHIAQLQRHIAVLEARPVVVDALPFEAVPADVNGERQS